MLLRVFLALLALVVAAGGYIAFDGMRAQTPEITLEPGYVFENENADLTVVEFMDYGCPSCQEIHPMISEAIERDGKILYSVRPVIGTNRYGHEAALLLYAAGEQGKYREAHEFLMTHFEEHEQNLSAAIVQALDLDPQRLVAVRDDPATNQKIIDNTDYLFSLGGDSIPVFLLGKDYLMTIGSPMPTVVDFLNSFDQARGK